jgi:hypothetical protein
MKIKILLLVILLINVLTFEAKALTEAERQQAIAQNEADLKRAVDAGDYDAASTALESLKKLKKAQAAAAKDPDVETTKEPKSVDDAFKTLRRWGLSLSLEPDADEGKGAHFGFNNDRHAGTDTVWDAQFYLKWDLFSLLLAKREEPVLDLGALRVDSLALSAQGKITSTDNTSTDAWRFRFESDSYLRLDQSKGGILRGLLVSLGAKEESDRDFHMNRISGELWLTPVAHRIFIGRFSGHDADPIQFRWRPWLGVDAGSSANESAVTGNESNVWLMARCKFELALNFMRDALHAQDVLLMIEDRVVYLTEQDTAHSYLKADFNIALTQSIGFALTYSIGKDSPKFQTERILTGGLTVKF